MSTVDRRRFAGPESAKPLQPKERQTTPEEVNKTSRDDHRAVQAVRPIFLKTGLVTQANGSAYIETGKHKLVCSVYGPHPVRGDVAFSDKAQLNVEVRFAPFATSDRRKAPGKETESKHLSAKLEQALKPALRLDLLPKSAIDLFVVILECDGPQDDISAGITASSVALAQAGIEMYGLVIGSCAAFLPPATASTHDIYRAPLLLDPTALEMQERASGLVSLACIPAMGTTTNVSMLGEFSRAATKQALQSLFDTCSAIHSVAADALRESTGL